MWEEFEREQPRLLGCLFDTLSRAIARKPTLRLSRRPRLADWGEYAAAVYEVMGWGAETFLRDWNEIVQVQNQTTLDGSPVAQAVIKFMEDKDEYIATSSELHKTLEVVAEALGVSIKHDKEWPKSARWLWRRIKVVLPLLVSTGIEARRDEDQHGSRIHLRKKPEDDATDATTNGNPEDEPKIGGDTDTDDATANGPGASNATRDLADRAKSGNSGNSYGDF
jgi:hypothetical protein